MNIKEYDEHCEAALRAIGKDEARFGKYIRFVHERDCRFAFVLEPEAGDAIYEGVWDSRSCIHMWTDRLCQRLLRPILADRVPDIRIPYEMTIEYIGYWESVFPDLPPDEPWEEFVGLVKATKGLAKDERIGKMLNTIVEAYIRTARETIAEWNGD